MLLCLWDSPGKNTGVGCHTLLQGIFLTQGTEPTSLEPPALAGGFFTTNAAWEAHRFITIPIKIPTAVFFSLRNGKADPEIHMELQGPQKTKITL